MKTKYLMFFFLAFLMIVALFGDIFIPRGLSGWVLYIIPLLFAFNLPPKFIINLVLIGAALQPFGFFLSEMSTIADKIALYNRVIGFITYLITAIVVYKYAEAFKKLKDAVHLNSAILTNMTENLLLINENSRIIKANKSALSSAMAVSRV